MLSWFSRPASRSSFCMCACTARSLTARWSYVFTAICLPSCPFESRTLAKTPWPSRALGAGAAAAGAAARR
eukprot:4813160-Prymnesium_polylepis.1